MRQFQVGPVDKLTFSVFISSIQAYVFVLLSTKYIGNKLDTQNEE